LRSEIRILLPVATLVLVVLSAFTLFSYRQALRQVADERRAEAARIARDLSTPVAAQAPSASVLSRIAPFALGVAVGDERGNAWNGAATSRTRIYSSSRGRFFPIFDTAFGPSAELRGTVAGFAPFGTAEARRVLRVDLAAPGLDAQTPRARRPALGRRADRRGARTVDDSLPPPRAGALRHPGSPRRGRRAKRRRGRRDSLAGRDLRARAGGAGARGRRAGGRRHCGARTGARAESRRGLLLLDRAGSVLALNSTGERLLGIPAPPPGAAFVDALSGHPALLARIREAVASGSGLQRAECSIELPAPADGDAVRGAPTRRLLGLTVHPLRRDDGALRGFIVLFADLTEIRRHEEESRLSESLTRIGELAAGIAHELRNSLATLRGYLTLIERRPGVEAVEDYLGEIRHETDHLQRVLDDFLMFARPGSVRLEDMNLETIVRRAALDPALGGAAVRLDLDADGGTLLRGDPLLIERAIRNLLHNAVEATSAGAEQARAMEPIVARVRRAGDEIVLEVEDRGRGIPESMRDRLFHPFATARSGGVGLGLALTRRIIDLHGGTIRVEPRPDGGTRAVVSLPATVT
jgi:signal transduction histidine kinase